MSLPIRTDANLHFLKALTPESKYDDPDYELKAAYWTSLKASDDGMLDALREARRETAKAESQARRAREALEALRASIAF